MAATMAPPPYSLSMEFPKPEATPEDLPPPYQPEWSRNFNPDSGAVYPINAWANTNNNNDTTPATITTTTRMIPRAEASPEMAIEALETPTPISTHNVTSAVCNDDVNNTSVNENQVR